MVPSTPPRQGDVSPEVSHVSMSAVRFCGGAREADTESEPSAGPRFDVAVSHREAPSRWRQGHGGESEAGACAKHFIVIARLAADLIFSDSVERPCRAAAVVVAHGTVALGGVTKRAWGANNRALGAVLSNLTRLATEGVRGVVARSTDRALAAAQERLVRAGRAFKAPGPVSTAWPIGSL